MSRLVAWKAALDWAASIAVICVCAVLISEKSRESGLPDPSLQAGLPSEPVDFAASATVGSNAASVVIVMFADFSCPYCAQFARETWPVLMADFISTGKVLFVFKHLPLTTIHPNAMALAVAADCSRQQGRFVEMHDRLFEAGSPVTPVEVRQFALDLGLDMHTCDSCVVGTGAAPVNKNLQTAQRFGIVATPTLLFGERIGDAKMRVQIRADGVLSRARLGQILAHRFGL